MRSRLLRGQMNLDAGGAHFFDRFRGKFGHWGVAADDAQNQTILDALGRADTFEAALRARLERYDVALLQDDMIVTLVALPSELLGSGDHHERLVSVVGVHHHALAGPRFDISQVETWAQMVDRRLCDVADRRIRTVSCGL